MQFARFKSLSSSLPRSKRWRQASDGARVLWVHLLLRSDPYGLIEIDDALWADELFPGDTAWTERRINKHRQELYDLQLLDVYVAAGGAHWCHLTNHDEFQSGEFKRKRPKRTSPELADMQALRTSGGTVPEVVPPVIGSGIGIESGSGSGIDLPLTGSSADDAKAPPPTARPVEVTALFEHWKTTFNKNAATVLDERRRRRLQWAIKQYTFDVAKKSITGYGKDDWPDRAKHNDITLLFRDAAHLERGLELADGLGNGNGNGRRMGSTGGSGTTARADKYRDGHGVEDGHLSPVQ